MTEYNTVLLDTSAWDLVLDAHGNIAMASPPYALAQDVSSAVRTFSGEVYYDTSLGVPYFADQQASILTQEISDQALTVPGVVSVTTTVTALSETGALSGQIAFTDESDQTTVISVG